MSVDGVITQTLMTGVNISDNYRRKSEENVANPIDEAFHKQEKNYLKWQQVLQNKANLKKLQRKENNSKIKKAQLKMEICEENKKKAINEIVYD